jgi:glycosyltransferase involved in cell wall biosynthesis
MSANWIGCVIAYNEAALLPGCLQSLTAQVDRLIVVEGRIEDFPGSGSTSTDNTLAIAQQYTDEVITPDLKAWPTEQAMRNQYLRGSAGDWYIILDADEVLLTPLPDMRTLRSPVYRVPLQMHGTSHHALIRRVYKHTGMMEYRHAHDAMYSDGILVSNGHEKVLPHVEVYHRQPLRSTERRALKVVKRQKTQAREKAFREHLAEISHVHYQIALRRQRRLHHERARQRSDRRRPGRIGRARVAGA